LRALGGEPAYLASEGFGKQVKDDVGIYADIIAKAGLKFD
jgi:hypothetical protein